MLDVITSVSIYIAFFIFALFFFWMAEAEFSKERLIVSDAIRGRKDKDLGSFWGEICSSIAILAISLLAGLRATSVGVDTSLYPVSLTNAALWFNSFFDFLYSSADVSAEPLGALLVWICSRLNLGVSPLLFCYQLFTILPVYLALRCFDNKVSLTAGMAVYIFFFFNNSLNMMRQSVACALLLLAVAIYLSNKKLKVSSIVACILAVLFHRSAIFGVVLIATVTLISRLNCRTFRLLLYAMIAIFPLVITTAAQWLYHSGLLDSHFLFYMDVFVTGDAEKDWFINPLSGYSVAYIFLYTIVVLLPTVLNSRFFMLDGNQSMDTGDNRLYTSLRTYNWVGYLIYIVLLFSLNTMYGMRFSLFFDYTLILSIAFSSSGENSRLKHGFLLVLLIAIWSIWIIRLGWSGSSIYTFIF